MKIREARALIEPAVAGHGGVWADLGAGSGTFTRALAQVLGTNDTVYAVDRDADALGGLTGKDAPNVIAVVADFTQPFTLPGLRDKLDGILLANALHFAAEAESVLARLVELLRPSGRVVLVEYDQRMKSRWVPYPVPLARLTALAVKAGLSTFRVVATRPSIYQGTIYSAVADRVSLRDTPVSPA